MRSGRVNVEAWALHRFLKTVLARAEHVRVVYVARQPASRGEVEEKEVKLGPLSSLDSARLFLRHLPDPSPVLRSLERVMYSSHRALDDFAAALSRRPLLVLLGNHVRSICRAAAVYPELATRDSLSPQDVALVHEMVAECRERSEDANEDSGISPLPASWWGEKGTVVAAPTHASAGGDDSKLLPSAAVVDPVTQSTGMHPGSGSAASAAASGAVSATGLSGTTTTAGSAGSGGSMALLGGPGSPSAPATYVSPPPPSTDAPSTMPSTPPSPFASLRPEVREGMLADVGQVAMIGSQWVEMLAAAGVASVDGDPRRCEARGDVVVDWFHARLAELTGNAALVRTWFEDRDECDGFWTFLGRGTQSAAVRAATFASRASVHLSWADWCRWWTWWGPAQFVLGCLRDLWRSDSVALAVRPFYQRDVSERVLRESGCAFAFHLRLSSQPGHLALSSTIVAAHPAGPAHHRGTLVVSHSLCSARVVPPSAIMFFDVDPGTFAQEGVASPSIAAFFAARPHLQVIVPPGVTLDLAALR